MLSWCSSLFRQVVADYFKVLQNLLKEYDLLDKSKIIFNTDGSDLQINNRPGEVLVEKSSKIDSVVLSSEKVILLHLLCQTETVWQYATWIPGIHVLFSVAGWTKVGRRPMRSPKKRWGEMIERERGNRVFFSIRNMNCVYVC